MSLPPFLVSELRSAFRSCAGQYSRINHVRSFSIGLPVNSKRSTRTQTTSKPQPGSPRKESDKKLARRQQETITPREQESELGLVPKEPLDRSLGSVQRPDVPLRVIPKADISPNLRLTPQEQLHIELLTRKAPARAEPKTYREKLLIYHHGYGRENALIFMKVASLSAAAFVTAVVVPAHIAAGTSPLAVTAFFACGLIPSLFLNFFTKPWVSRVFLHLPERVRESPRAALEYAKNLPSSATLDIDFMRAIPLPGTNTLRAQMADLVPTKGRLRSLTFKWTGPNVDTGTFLRPNPTEFYVMSRSARGKAARFTIPGIWENVYLRLAKPQSETGRKRMK